MIDTLMIMSRIGIMLKYDILISDNAMGYISLIISPIKILRNS